MRKTANKLISGTLLQWADHLRPQYCCICYRFLTHSIRISTSTDLCTDCRAQLPTLNWRIGGLQAPTFYLCPYCGTDQFVTNEQRLDCACGEHSRLFTSMLAPYRYRFPMNSLVQEFKYRQRFYLGRVLGQLLASAAIEQSVPRPEVLLPVPMPEDRFKDRGFNSAQIIAEVVARELALPIESHWATRLENTVALAGMSRERRQMSIRGAFGVSDRVYGRHVGIVDDVLTTGATSSELARECFDTGARAVSVWVVARTASN